MNIASASQSRPQGLVSRAPTIASTSRPRYPKFQTSRNFVVFPVQLGKEKSPLEAFPFTSYTTIDLKTRHNYDPNLAQDVGEIWVDTANYYKQKQSPQHEFIIFSVTTSNGMQNFIALDRNVNVKGSAALVSRGGKNGPPAQDYFHVSHYGDVESLINHCAHTTSDDMCTHVEQVAFERKAFSFAELVVLASTVSEVCPAYQLGATNCYWFASLIWECMFNVFGKGVANHNKHTEERGKFRGMKIQGNHNNFQDVVQKYRKDFFEFTRGLKDDAMSVIDRSSRRFSTQITTLIDAETVTSTQDQALELRRSRTVSQAIPANAPRPQSSNMEGDRRSERTRATSLCPTGKSQDPTSRRSATINKDLPSLPPSAPAPQPSHSRSHPDDHSKRNSRATIGEPDFLTAPLPDAVKRTSNRYSDIGKNFEQATTSLAQPSSRPSSYVAPPQKQVQFEASPSRVPDSARLKVHSLPARSSSPNGDLNKDRSRSPSLPVGSAPPEIRERKDSQAMTADSSGDSTPRARTTSGLGRLRRALPKLLLPTVSESEDRICESPENSPWVELESSDYLENHPFADNASERLSFIEFPQPPGVRVAQGHRSHRVHPSRVELVDGSRKRKSKSPAAGDRDSKCSVVRT